MRRFLIVSVLSLLYGAGMVALFAAAVGHQQVVMQEGY